MSGKDGARRAGGARGRGARGSWEKLKHDDGGPANGDPLPLSSPPIPPSDSFCIPCPSRRPSWRHGGCSGREKQQTRPASLFALNPRCGGRGFRVEGAGGTRVCVHDDESGACACVCLPPGGRYTKKGGRVGTMFFCWSPPPTLYNPARRAGPHPSARVTAPRCARGRGRGKQAPGARGPRAGSCLSNPPWCLFVAQGRSESKAKHHQTFWRTLGEQRGWR